MSFTSFLSDFIATVLGGAIFTFLYFMAKEKWFPLPKITGRWYWQQTTETTAYAPYDGMVLGYIAILWCEGNRVQGTVEKIYEKSSTGERAFVGKNRTRGTVSGYIEKRYLGKDKIYLHFVEDGHGRESTYFYSLTDGTEETMIGTFNSMVADQAGTTKWQRTSF
jgi:hypothetical protein